MASKGKKKPSLYDLSREPLRQEDFPKLTLELTQATDRSSALVGSAMVEGALLTALNARFVKMTPEDFEGLFFKQTAPLQTFSSRIKIGFAIGIYQTTVRDALDCIRRIRNVFAHSVRPLEFSHELIEAEFGSLVDAGFADIGFDPKGHKLHPLRERYITNCIDLARLLEQNAMKHFGKSITIDLGDVSSEPAPLPHKSK